MAFSYTEHIGDGSTTAFSFGFTGPDKGYIRPSDLVVLVDGVEDPNFSLTSTNTLEMDVAPADGAIVRIRRVMPKEAPYTDFSRGNKFGEANLNNSFLQTLYTVHEFQDGWFPEGFRFLSGVGFASDVDFEGFDIDNVGTLQVDDVIIGAEQLSLADSVAEAYNWAQYPYNSPVPEGSGTEYSAYHYSVLSDDSRVLSEVARDASIAARDAAQSAQGAAETARDAAQGFANAASNSSAQSGTYASQSLTYSNNSLAASQAAATSEANALSSANTAGTFADDSQDSATESFNWAQYAENSPVPEGNGSQYSSYHYSRKAAGSATQAASSASTAGGYATDAQGFANDASDSASAAAQSALDAQASADSIDSSAFMGVGGYLGALDDLVDAGTYRVQNQAGLPTGTDYGNLLVLRFPGSDTIAQFAASFDSNWLWWRGGNPSQTGGAGSWGPWVQLNTGRTDLLWQGNSREGETGTINATWDDYDLILVSGRYDNNTAGGFGPVANWYGAISAVVYNGASMGIYRISDTEFQTHTTGGYDNGRFVEKIWGVKL